MQLYNSIFQAKVCHNKILSNFTLNKYMKHKKCQSLFITKRIAAFKNSLTTPQLYFYKLIFNLPPKLES